MRKKILQKISVTFLLLGLLPLSSALASDRAPYCGDGMVSPEYGEECDDANYDLRDGCDSYCKLEDMEPPFVSYTDIPNGQTDVSTLTDELRITFSEPMDPSSINNFNIRFKQFNEEIEITLELLPGDTELVIHIEEELQGNKDYAIIVEHIKDAVGNRNDELFVSTFYTGDYIDIVPPNIVARPPGGNYHVAQSVTLSPYIGKITFSDEYLDEEARLYYTLDGSTPGTHSPQYESSLSIKNNTTLKYFGIDAEGNVSRVQTQEYTFTCADRPHAKSVTPYPECNIEECMYGYRLQNDVCVIVMGEEENDFKAAAATAPLFGSDTPMTISTKPALYITPEHEGILPRPIHFVDLLGGSVVDFERDTFITYQSSEEPFTGYIKPPDNLYTKSFPINFGYSFKSIFQFEPVEGGELKFDPMIKITIPFTQRYDEGAKITVFTYDPNVEEYYPYDPELVEVSEDGEAVQIMSDSTGIFFVAQPGTSYNAIVFKDTVDHWAKNYIEQLYRWGFVKGRSKGVFAPDDILTRAEFVKIALNAIGEEVDPLEEIEDSPFQDVALYAWYVPYLKRAKDLGLIEGYPDGSFRPDEPINRVEAIKILLTGFDFELTSVGQRIDNYFDVLTWEWYFPAVNFAIQHHLIDGLRLPNGKILYDAFGPGRDMLRGEMAKLAVKAIELRELLNEEE